MNTNLHIQSEADIAAYIAMQQDLLKEKFSDLIEPVRVYVMVSPLGAFSLWGYTDENYTSRHGYGNTIAEAAADLRAKLGTPSDRAKKLREEAATKLALAQSLEATPAAA